MKYKTTKLVFILIVALLVVSMSLGLAACKDNNPIPDDKKEDGVETETTDISFTNGNFRTYTTGEAPMKPSTWSQYSSAIADTYVSGVINVDETEYATDKANWDSLDNPGKPEVPNDLDGKKFEGYDDDYLLMLYNVSSTANYYGHSNFKVEKGAYYKMVVAVKTVNVEGTGATIDFSSGAYHTFKHINTNNSWQYYTFYVAGSHIDDITITVRLYLGYGAASNTSNPDLTSGYAFFDNFIAEEIELADYEQGIATINENTMDKIANYNLRLPDAGFSTASSSTAALNTAPTGWSDASNPYYSSNSSDTKDGIVDAANFDSLVSAYSIISDWQSTGSPLTFADIPGWKTIEEQTTVEENGETQTKTVKKLIMDPSSGIRNFDSKVYLILNNKEAAFGVKGGRKISVAPGEYYVLSLYVLTTGINEAYEAINANNEDDAQDVDVFTKGAYIKLGDGVEASFDTINTLGTWTKYSFYLAGNTSRTTTIDLSLWLGQGDADDKDNLTIGAALFDLLELTAIDENTFNNATESTTVKKVDLKTESENVVSDVNLSQMDATVAEGVQNVDTDFDKIVIPGTALVSEDAWKAAVDGNEQLKAFNVEENPLSPINNADFDVTLLANRNLTASTIKFADAVVHPNSYYRLALYAKTMDIIGKGTITIALMSGEGKDAKTLSSFTTVNTKDYTNRLTNNYAEYVFYIQGSSINDLSDKTVYLNITMGSGTKLSTDNFLIGKLFVCDLNMEAIDFDEYDKVTTGTYVKTYSFATSNSVISNGNFDTINASETEFYTKADEQNTEIKVTAGDLKSIATAKNWEKKAFGSDVIDDLKVELGIAGIENKQLLKDINLINDTIYNADSESYLELAKAHIYNAWVMGTNTYTEKPYGANNFYVIRTKGAEATKPVGITSDSVSLTANKYYKFTVMVKTIDATTASIRLTNKSDSNSMQVVGINTSNDWAIYTFAVKTAIQSASINIELYFGNINLKDDATSGTVLFDSVVYEEIDKDEYEELSTEDPQVQKTNFDTNSFDVEIKADTTTIEKLQDSDTFSASTNGTPKSANTATTAGLVNKTYSDKSVVMGTKADAKDEALSSTLTDDQWNWLFDNKGMDEYGLSTGNNIIAINNLVAHQNNLVNSSAWSLTADTYYEISIFAKTLALAKDKGAKIVFAVGDKYDSVDDADYVAGEDDKFVFYVFDDINTSTYGAEDAETAGDWQKFSFFVKTNSDGLSSVYLYMFLGEASKAYTEQEARELLDLDDDTSDVDTTNKTKFVQGYAFFDNLTITELTPAQFNVEKAKFEAAEQTYLSNNVVKVYDEDDIDDDDTDPEDEEPEEETQQDWTNSQFFWLYITSIVIGGLLILAIIAFTIRKYWPVLSKKLKLNKLSKTSPDYDKNKTQETKKGKKDASDSEFKD